MTDPIDQDETDIGAWMDDRPDEPTDSPPPELDQ